MHHVRAKVVHELVDAANLDVRDWGNVDAAHPSEVVEMLIGGLVGVALEKLVDFLIDRLKPRKPGDEGTLKAITLRRPDGHELVWHFSAGVSSETAERELQRFLDNKSVDRWLGSSQR